MHNEEDRRTLRVAARVCREIALLIAELRTAWIRIDEDNTEPVNVESQNALRATWRSRHPAWTEAMLAARALSDSPRIDRAFRFVAAFASPVVDSPFDFETWLEEWAREIEGEAEGPKTIEAEAEVAPDGQLAPALALTLAAIDGELRTAFEIGDRREPPLGEAQVRNHLATLRALGLVEKPGREGFRRARR